MHHITRCNITDTGISFSTKQFMNNPLFNVSFISLAPPANSFNTNNIMNKNYKNIPFVAITFLHHSNDFFLSTIIIAKSKSYVITSSTEKNKSVFLENVFPKKRTYFFIHICGHVPARHKRS